MTNSTLEKARYNLNRAEYWQEKAEALEAWAGRRAAQQQQGRMSRKDGSEIDPGLIASTLLDDRFAYREAVGNRNAYQRRAEIYLMASLAGISETAGFMDASGKTHVP